MNKACLSMDFFLRQHGRYMQDFYDMNISSILCDATIHLDNGTSFLVHRAVLSACSPFFRALFNNAEKYTEENITLHGVNSHFLANILKYVYLQELDIKEEAMLDLLVTADYLCVDGVVQKCLAFIQNHLRPENCIGILHFARTHVFAELERATWRYATSQFPAVSQFSVQLLEMPAPDLCRLLDANELNAPSEEAVWQVALRWLDHRPDDRKQYLPKLLAIVRLPLMDRRNFVSQVMDNPFVLADGACHSLVANTFESFHRPDVRPLVIAEPRLPNQILFVIGGWFNAAPTNLIETYDTRANKWRQVAVGDEVGPSTHHATAVLGHYIYLLGGFDVIEYLNACRCFNAVTKAWNDVSPMNVRRGFLSAAVLGGYIYAMGGYDGNHRLKSVERYIPYYNQWFFVAPMNSRRSDASAAVLNGSIYVVGGFNGRDRLRSAEVYNPDTNQWTFIRPMTTRRSSIRCVAYHGYVYAIGGFDGSSSLKCGERYCPDTDSWFPLRDMRYARSNFALEVADDTIYAIGGYEDNHVVMNVEHFNDSVDEWLEAANTMIPRHGMSAAVIQDIPNTEEYVERRRENGAAHETPNNSANGSQPCEVANVDQSLFLITLHSEDSDTDSEIYIE